VKKPASKDEILRNVKSQRHKRNRRKMLK